MSMALVLEHTQEWLRSKNGWTFQQCGVQFDAIPPLDNPGAFYVAIDDAGVEPGPDETDSLKEICSITVGIWRRPEHFAKALRGNLKLPLDKYLVGAWTLSELERAVIVHKSAGTQIRHGLHNNWTYLSSLNERYNLPCAEYGAGFTQPLRYRGRGRSEVIAIEGTTDTTAWFGYRLRFRGCHREQKLRLATDAIG